MHVISVVNKKRASVGGMFPMEDSSRRLLNQSSRYGDREVSEAKRLKALEDEGGMIGRSQRVDQSLVNTAG